MKATVGGTLRMLGGVEVVYVEANSPAIVNLAVSGTLTVLREAVMDGVDIDELARVLATGGLSVVGASLFDTTDSRLQALSARYREYSRTDCESAPTAEVDAGSRSAWKRRG